MKGGLVMFGPRVRLVCGNRSSRRSATTFLSLALFLTVLVLPTVALSQRAVVSPASVVWSTKLQRNVLSAATLGDGFIAVATEDGVVHLVGYAGNVVSRIHTGKRLISSPVVDGNGNLYLTSEDGDVVCYSPSGVLLWSYNVGSKVLSEPALGPSGNVYVSTESGEVYALSRSGELLWSVEFEATFKSPPSVWFDETLYLASVEGKVYAISRDGEVLWIFETSDRFFAAPTPDYDGKVLVASAKGVLYVVEDGDRLWSAQVGAPVYSEVVTGLSDDYYVATLDGRLVAFEVEWSEEADYFTLVKKWERRLESGSLTSPIVGINGTVYVSDLKGRLYGFSTDGELRWYANLGKASIPSGLTRSKSLITVSLDGDVVALASVDSGLEMSPWPKFRGNHSCTGLARRFDHGVTFGNFGITGLFYRDRSNWERIVNAVFGPEYRVADWYDLVNYFDLGGDLLELFDNLGLTLYESAAYVTVDGSRSYSSSRFYFASRHEHELPEYYLAHDHIDDFLISLGSWYGENKILVIRRDFAAKLSEEARLLRKPGKLFWKFKTGGYIWSSPAVDEEGNVYVGSYDNRLYAFAPDGTLLWSFEADGGIGTSPAIGPNGMIYFGDDAGTFYALNKDGSYRLIWRLGVRIRTGPVVGNDGRVYFATRGGLFVCLDEYGSVVWSFTLPNDIECEPALDEDGTLYFGDTAGVVYAVSHEGIPNEIFRAEGAVDSGFAIHDGPFGKTIYFVSRDGHLYAIAPDGTLRWRFELPVDDFYTYSSPVVGPDGTVYVGDFDGGINAISPEGELLWRFETGESVRSTPLVTAEGIIYVGSTDGYLYALNTSGKLLWRYGRSEGFGSSPTVGPNGVIYVGSWDDHLYAIFSSSTRPDGSWPKFKGSLRNDGRAH